MSVRPVRGQCVVRELRLEERSHSLPWAGASRILWTPRPNDREITWYLGRVLALGAPAFLDMTPNAPEVPWDIEVGMVVVYTFVHNMGEFTRPWSDGKPASWVPQAAVVGEWVDDVN